MISFPHFTMKIGILPGIAFLLIQLAIADPVPGGEIHVGQTLAAARAILELNKIPAIERYPFAVFVSDDSKLVAYILDKELVLTLHIDPRTESIRGMSTDFVPTHRTSKADTVVKSVKKLTLHTSSEYSIQFLRALRTPEQGPADSQQEKKRVEEK